MAKTAFKNITFLIGAISMFAAGLIYMIMSDLSFGNTSVWLIIATVLSFGGALIFFFANSFAEKPALMYFMKILGLVLSVGFVAFLHYFNGTEYFVGKLNEFIDMGLSGEKKLALSKATIIISWVLAYAGALGQIVNIVAGAAIKEK